MFIGKVGEELEECKVASIREHGSRYLLKLSGVGSIEEAEEFWGAEIYLRKEVLAEKEEGEFFHYELLDLNVYLDTGHYLGVLKRIFETGSNDVYVVKRETEELLIPATTEVIRRVDITAKTVTVNLFEGMNG